MEDVLSLAWAHVKWEEDVASRPKAQQKQDNKTIRSDRTERDEKPSQRPARDSENQNRGTYQNRPIKRVEGMAVSTWPDISHLSAGADQCSEGDRPTCQVASEDESTRLFPEPWFLVRLPLRPRSQNGGLRHTKDRGQRAA
ncbi:hypothetical protein F2Q70_00004256 [Brassica cretica]|uniref:Uncharacterized protein n=2 Tax=Brassica cretica TaxID=69181 RepID=A0A3N6QX43_BRACR|nr:hypothetical protein F2Q70_00004256 [Brassica cretica]KAF2598908.1 hypothetical protein F2Q68_00010239 [Brassica cretica]KAF3563713.1 hypothetical protein DY000_02016211 [Brassica cretica]